MARAIPRSFTGTVITPSVPVAVELADRPGIEILLAGGRVRPGDLACSNAHTKAFFADIYAARSYILADSAKLGQVAPYRVCGLGEVDGLITDRNTPTAIAAAFQEPAGVVPAGPNRFPESPIP
ncbi:DeoR/GlpR family DNA-binding transcription regulator [Mycolicibacterium sarraceniae]|uniref:DeoR family transcriptional regulator n=1 Tax=Mycolicibacterium sarraceniae TaxID=1534348 RepID=A0A7I7SVM7_9MYCO|nr:hypothetical protein [Mycolicibacterium sarraceniae]BBY60858.1 hypothetical protein MSAR_39940 [Mycolicibacterium sarraceniae]